MCYSISNDFISEQEMAEKPLKRKSNQKYKKKRKVSSNPRRRRKRTKTRQGTRPVKQSQLSKSYRKI